jgi:hypothetical protein
MIGVEGACDRHWPALVDFVDRGERSARTPAALAHLDRCARCREDLEATALAIHALRRLGDEVARTDVPAGARPRDVRRRRAPQPVSAASALAGLIATVAIIAGASTLSVDVNLNSWDAAPSRTSLAEPSATVAMAVGRPRVVLPDAAEIRKRTVRARLLHPDGGQDQKEVNGPGIDRRTPLI